MYKINVLQNCAHVTLFHKIWLFTIFWKKILEKNIETGQNYYAPDLSMGAYENSIQSSFRLVGQVQGKQHLMWGNPRIISLRPFQFTWAEGSSTLLCTYALSVVRPSLTFHIFDFSSETSERNSTKLDRKQDLNVLYKVCVFRADRKNKMAALTSDWLRNDFRLLLWNGWTEFNEFLWSEFNETCQQVRTQRPLPSLCCSGRSENKDGLYCLWFADTFSTSPLKPLNRLK